MCIPDSLPKKGASATEKQCKVKSGARRAEKKQRRHAIAERQNGGRWRHKRLQRLSKVAAKRRRATTDGSKEEPTAKQAKTFLKDDGKMLLGDLIPDSKWTYPIKDEEWQCFAGHLPGALTQEEGEYFFEVVRDGTKWTQPKGRWGPLPLKTAWMVRAPCTCQYGYGGAQVAPDPFPEWMDELLGACMPLCGLPEKEAWPNSCNLNMYEDGQHSVGWHSDNESLFQGKKQEIRIISLSLGQTRKFELKYGNQVTKLDLEHGDLCTMEGWFQKYFTHRVPKENGKNIKPRINLTFRWIVEHLPSCPLHAPPADKSAASGGASKEA